MKEFTFVLSEDETLALMWLVEGNSAYGYLAQVLQAQIDNQP